MFDSNLFLRTGGVGSMSSTETATAVQINECPAKGLACVVVIPKKDIGDTLQVTLQESTDNSTFATFLTFSLIASVTITNSNPFRQIRRFHSRAKYIRSISTVAGTTPDFGAVQIFIGDADLANNYTVGPILTAAGLDQIT